MHCSQAVPNALSHLRFPDLHCRHAEPGFMARDAGNAMFFSRDLNSLEPDENLLAGDLPENLAKPKDRGLNRG